MARKSPPAGNLSAPQPDLASLQKCELRLARILDIARIGSWELDLCTWRADWAPETRHILGVDPLAPAEPATVLAATDPADRDLVRGALRDVMAGSATYDVTYRVIWPDGSRHVIHSRADVMRDSSGQALRLIGIVQDITEQEHLRAQLLQSQKMETVGRLAAGIAHDLNNMLQVIVSSCVFASDESEGNAPLVEDLAMIRDAAERATGLTQGLLAFSRQQKLWPRTIDVNEVISDLRKMLGRLVGGDITLNLRLAPGPVVVVADPNQLAQVLANLAVNARDAMPNGGSLTIRTGHEQLPTELAGGESVSPLHVHIAVEDTGDGMDETTLSRIFEPFFSTKTPQRGTGLGLATAYGFVAQSGGHMRASSVRGQGSTFDVYLPVAAAAVTPVEPEIVESGGDCSDATVLVVDDDAPVRRTVARALRRAGYAVLEASDGNEALERHRGERCIDVLVTDVLLPFHPGREVADLLTARHPGIRVLYMSGHAGDALLKDRGPRDGDPFIAKPFTPDALVRQVQALLGERVAVPA